MPLNLSKGESLNLSKASPSLQEVCVAIGWKAAKEGEKKIDLDIAAFILKQNPAGADKTPVVISANHVVYFHNKTSPNGEVTLDRDNQNGDGDGDDETILNRLVRMHPDAIEVSFVMSIYDQSHGQTLKEAKDAFVRVYDGKNGEEIARYNLEDQFGDMDSVQVGSLFLNQDGWHFKAIGNGAKGLDLNSYAAAYGLD